MAKIGTSLPEVAILMTIPGIALKSTLCIIAELGDIRRSHSANAINAYIGVDLTTYQSGTIRPSSIFENVEPFGKEGLVSYGHQYHQRFLIPTDTL